MLLCREINNFHQTHIITTDEKNDIRNELKGILLKLERYLMVRTIQIYQQLKKEFRAGKGMDQIFSKHIEPPSRMWLHGKTVVL